MRLLLSEDLGHYLLAAGEPPLTPVGATPSSAAAAATGAVVEGSTAAGASEGGGGVGSGGGGGEGDDDAKKKASASAKVCRYCHRIGLCLPACLPLSSTC